MKIIHLIGGGDVGGVKTNLIMLLSGLSKTDQIKLISFMEGPFVDDARRAGIDTEVLSGNVTENYRVLKKMILENGYELVHCHGTKGNFYGSLLKNKLNIPIISTVHSDYRHDYDGQSWKMFSHGTINHLTLRQKDYFITGSETLSDLLCDQGFPPDCIYTIHNGISADTVNCMTRSEFYESIGFQINKDDVVIGIAARLVPSCDLMTVLQAMNLVIKEDDRIKLVIAGTGEFERAFKDKAEELHLMNNVCFTGWLSPIKNFYKSIDINLVPMRSAGVPYSLLEGGCFSKATICERGTGADSLLIPEVNGLLYKRGNAQNLAEKILNLASDELKRARLGIRLNDVVKNDFTVEKMICEHHKVYSRIQQRYLHVENNREGVVICGSYGRRNAGDDAILKAIISELKDLDPDMMIKVMSVDPKETRRRFRVRSFYTFNPISMFLAFRHSRLYLNGGGTLLQNATSNRSLYFYLNTLKYA